MSKFVIYLDVEPYMKQWLTHAYGDPVVFPASSSENAVIRRLTTKRPSDNVPEQPSERLSPSPSHHANTKALRPTTF